MSSIRRARSGELVVIDLRPREAHEAGHIPGTVSIPLDHLEGDIDRPPPDAEIAAYCRGPFCVMAPQGIAILRRRGLRAPRFEER